MQAVVNAFFDPATFTFSYIVRDPLSQKAAVIDPVLDYDAKSGRTDTRSVDTLIKFIRDHDLDITWILETHIHADHLSGAQIVKAACGGNIGVSNHVGKIQTHFGQLYNIADSIRDDGSDFDHLFADDETFQIGGLVGHVMHTPGHTPACATYHIDGCAFVGDTLFMPDYGTARTDFPGGDAKALYHSIEKILALPENTVLFMCHDYATADRKAGLYQTTVADQRANNIHLKDISSEDEYVRLRNERDSKLSAPALIHPSIQVNIRAGKLPETEDNGTAYLKIPLDAI
jgi:glyoxylase-like metal-dependent hydrolase (beta-lactamase superfamily II)